MRDVLAQIGQRPGTQAADRGALLTRLRHGDSLHELVPDVDHGNAVQREHSIQGLDRLTFRKVGLGDQGDGARRQGGRTQDGPSDQFSVDFEDHVQIGPWKLDGPLGNNLLDRSGLGRRGGRRRRCGSRA